MERTLTEVCTYLNTLFWEKKIRGTFHIEGGAIEVPALKDGQYFCISGSTFNNGVHLYPATDLRDEDFEGEIMAMAVPETVIALTSDIEEWQAKYGTVNSTNMSPFTSESFSVYSYSKQAGGGTGGGSNTTWMDAFRDRLNPYRRLRGAR